MDRAVYSVFTGPRGGTLDESEEEFAGARGQKRIRREVTILFIPYRLTRSEEYLDANNDHTWCAVPTFFLIKSWCKPTRESNENSRLFFHQWSSLLASHLTRGIALAFGYMLHSGRGKIFFP